MWWLHTKYWTAVFLVWRCGMLNKICQTKLQMLVSTWSNGYHASEQLPTIQYAHTFSDQGQGDTTWNLVDSIGQPSVVTWRKLCRTTLPPFNALLVLKSSYQYTVFNWRVFLSTGKICPRFRVWNCYGNLIVSGLGSLAALILLLNNIIIEGFCAKRAYIGPIFIFAGST